MDVHDPIPTPPNAKTTPSQLPTSTHIEYAHVNHVLSSDDTGHETFDLPQMMLPLKVSVQFI